MKKVFFNLLFMSTLIMMLTSMSQKDEDHMQHRINTISDSEFTFEIINDSIVITGLEIDDDFEVYIQIPTRINGLPVVKIADLAFNGRYVSYTVVGVNFEQAFYLTTIGESSFQNQMIPYLIFDGAFGLTHINEGAFSSNRIAYINFGDAANSLLYIDNNAFSMNRPLSGQLNLSNLTYLREIGHHAFQATSLTSVTISGLNYLQSIRSGAFSYGYISHANLSFLPSLIIISEGAAADFSISVFGSNYIQNLYDVFIYGTPALENLNSEDFSIFLGAQLTF